MTNKELKKLKRADLLEMLINQSRKNETLEKQLSEATEYIRQREISISKAGSIAEAALQLNGVFAAAQDAGAQYLENIERLSGEQEKLCSQMAEESRQKAARLLVDAEQKCQTMENSTRKKCEDMLAAAESESKEYWNAVSQKLESFYEAHKGLQEMLPLNISKGNRA